MLIFQRTLWQRITLSAYLLSEKINRKLLKLLFVANGQVSALITPERPPTDNFERFFTF
jgi:hypothetical protein